MVPFRVDDGRWSVPFLISDGTTFPFADKGDHETFVYRQRFSFDRGTVIRRAPMSILRVPRGIAYLTRIGDVEDFGDGRNEQEFEYSSVPLTRSEPASISFVNQYYRQAIEGEGEDLTVTDELSEATYTLPGEYVYEYFRDTQPAPILKRRAFFIFETLNFVGEPPVSLGRIVAEDSEVGIYAGRIYYRKTPYVSVPQPRPIF